MAAGREALRARLLATFRGEAEELIAEIAANLRLLDNVGEAQDAGGPLEATFRAMHTLKGAARSVSLQEVEGLCQGCETVLRKITRGEVEFRPAIVQELRQATRQIERLLAQGPLGPANGQPAVPAPDPELRPVAPPPPRPDPVASGDTIRIETSQFDSLIAQIEDLLLPKLEAEERAREAKDLPSVFARCRKLMRAARIQPDSHRHRQLMDQAIEALEEGERLAGSTATNLDRHSRALQGAVNSLVSDMRRARMTPAAAVLDLLPEMTDDLARAAGKEAHCTIVGRELAIDRMVLQAIKDPLIHLARNAVDHGIEPPEQRLAAGKPRAGRVTVKVEAREGARIRIDIADDGGGIDLDMVKAAAIRRRIAAPEAIDQMTQEETLRLIFRSSVSTRPVATAVSGQGLGLAIVAERVERLNGSIAIENRPGQGTAFHIDIPASVASFFGLSVRVREQHFLLPMDAVGIVARADRTQLAQVSGRSVAEIAGQPVACGSLGSILGIGDEAPEGSGLYVVVTAGGESAAFRVDEVLGTTEVLLKTLQPPLIRVRNVAAAALLPTGELGVVLRPLDLVNSLRRAEAPALSRQMRAPQARRHTLLVVDDSITTRAMERSLLQAIGYRVHVASDGIDAWNTLMEEEIDLVISDVDMPRMDGFELTRRVRADRRLTDLPIILVSALENRQDKEQGIRAGANAYVIKSNLENTNLQEIIERLL